MKTLAPPTMKKTVGYLQVIQTPVHKLYALNTAVRRVFHVVQTLESKHIVLTGDEALYPKLMEIKWSVSEYKNLLIPCLGGLHAAMNFHGVLEWHMQDYNLCESWVECDILGVNAVQ